MSRLPLSLRFHLVTFSTFAVFFGLDVITKYIVEKKIGIYEKINIIGEFVQLTKIYNQGGVFGIMQGHQKFFLIVSVIVLLLLIFFYIHEKNKTFIFSIALGLVFSGALGNITDRVIGRRGVVDFIYIGIEKVYKWPAFNVADMSIICGAVLLILSFYAHERAKKKTLTSE